MPRSRRTAQEIVARLRARKMTYADIADLFGVHYSTSRMWSRSPDRIATRPARTPKKRRADPRRADLVDAVRGGMSVIDASIQHDVFYGTALLWCRADGVTTRQTRIATKRRAVCVIAALINTTETYETIAKRVVVPETYVGQLAQQCREEGIELHPLRNTRD